MAYVLVTNGRLPESLSELLRAMRERIPDRSAGGNGRGRRLARLGSDCPCVDGNSSAGLVLAGIVFAAADGSWRQAVIGPAAAEAIVIGWEWPWGRQRNL